MQNMNKKSSLNRKKFTPLIVLASGSASRRRQLESLGFDFKVEVSGINEEIYKNPPLDGDSGIKSPSGKKAKSLATSSIGDNPHLSPLAQGMGKVAQKIAQAKVEKVALKYPKAVVLGGDQMACLNTQIFNKPLTSKQAIKSLMALQGKNHILFTALYMRYGEKSFSYLETNKMTMRKLSPDQIKAYVEKANPLQCAGAYALERCGIGLFEKIDTKDQSAVIGFPLITLLNQLSYWGIPLPFLQDPAKELNQTGFANKAGNKGATSKVFPISKVGRKHKNHALDSDRGSNKSSII